MAPTLPCLLDWVVEMRIGWVWLVVGFLMEGCDVGQKQKLQTTAGQEEKARLVASCLVQQKKTLPLPPAAHQCVPWISLHPVRLKWTSARSTPARYLELQPSF